MKKTWYLLRTSIHVIAYKTAVRSLDKWNELRTSRLRINISYFLVPSCIFQQTWYYTSPLAHWIRYILITTTHFMRHSLANWQFFCLALSCLRVGKHIISGSQSPTSLLLCLPYHYNCYSCEATASDDGGPRTLSKVNPPPTTYNGGHPPTKSSYTSVLRVFRVREISPWGYQVHRVLRPRRCQRCSYIMVGRRRTRVFSLSRSPLVRSLLRFPRINSQGHIRYLLFHVLHRIYGEKISSLGENLYTVSFRWWACNGSV